MSHQITLTRKENGWITVECPELPGCISQGRTEAEARRNIKEAISAWLLAEEQKRGESRS
jgi:predicted RNase H-like HicB family nuclease